MNHHERITAASNLDRIENMLGRPITPGTVDIHAISERSLTPTEIQHICADLDRIDFLRGKDTGHDMVYELKVLALVTIISLIVYGIRQLFGLG